MTLPQFALDYDACKYHELRRFIHNRTGQKAPMAKKAAILRTLQDLDANTHFRFLDLHPEIRNSVYELVLRHNKVQGLKAYPALLRTCKQVYSEGRSILNHDSVATMSVQYTQVPMMASWAPGEQIGWNYLLVAEGGVPFRSTARYVRWLSQYAIDLTALPLAQTLHLEIKLSTHAPQGQMIFDNWFLLQEFLQILVQKGNHVRSLRITVKCQEDGRALHPDRLSERLGVSMLVPLQKLSQEVALEVHGFSQVVYDKYWRLAKKSHLETLRKAEESRLEELRKTEESRLETLRKAEELRLETFGNRIEKKPRRLVMLEELVGQSDN